MGIILGIDLGTTFSAVAYWDESTGTPVVVPNEFGQLTTPSVIWSDGNVVHVGQQAVEKRASGIEPIEFVKRGMGDPEYSRPLSGTTLNADELSALILAKLVKDANFWLKKSGISTSCIKDVMISVPAYFGNPQREATIKAGYLAKLNVIGTINEPTAAAISHGAGMNMNKAIMVFDLGGGTFDVTIMKLNSKGDLEVIVSYGNMNIGGKDWDAELQDYLIDRLQEDYNKSVPIYDLSLLRDEARDVKIALSRSEKASAKYEQINIPITRAEFEKKTKRLIAKCRAACKIVMDDAKKKKGIFSWDDIQELVLVGGSSRMPMIHNLAGDFFKGEIKCSDDLYDLAVAKGAAIYARNAIKITDVAPKSLGIRLDNGFQVMISNNTPLPCSVSKDFYAPVSAKVTILQGTGESLLGYIDIGEIALKNNRAENVKITFSYDINGVINISSVFRNGEEKSLRIQSKFLHENEINRIADDQKGFKEILKKLK
ncbi:MAG: Hsp70 family protein [Chlorobium sp.]